MTYPSLEIVARTEATLPGNENLDVRQAVLWLAGLDPEKLLDYDTYNPLKLSRQEGPKRRFRSARFWFGFLAQFQEFLETTEGKTFLEDTEFSRLSFGYAYRHSDRFSHYSLNNSEISSRWKRRVGRAIVRRWNLSLLNGELNDEAIREFLEAYEGWLDFFNFADTLTEKIRDAMWELKDQLAHVTTSEFPSDDNREYGVSFHRNAVLSTSTHSDVWVGLETWQDLPRYECVEKHDGLILDRSKLLDVFVHKPARELEAWQKRVMSWNAWPLDWTVHFLEIGRDYKQLKNDTIQSESGQFPLVWTSSSLDALLNDEPERIDTELVESFLDGCRSGKIKCRGYCDGIFRKISSHEWANLGLFYDHEEKSLFAHSKIKKKTTIRFMNVVVERATFEAWLGVNPKTPNDLPTIEKLFEEMLRRELATGKIPIKIDQIQWIRSRGELTGEAAERLRGRVLDRLPDELRESLTGVGRRGKKRSDIIDD